MSIWSDPQLRRDVVKLLFLFSALFGTLTLFAVSPSLSTPAFVAVVITLLLSPAVAALERRGYHRTHSILIIFGLLSVGVLMSGIWALESGNVQWHSFREKVPVYFHGTIDRMKDYETGIKARFPVLESIQPTDALLSWGKENGKWFVDHGPALMGDLLLCLLVAPFLTFVMLKDGPTIRRRAFSLIPNRYFEVLFLITHQISTSLADYIRAKLVEATLVAAMTGLGLALVQAPYAAVLALLAGITNIVPYAGPVIGAVPGLLIVALDPQHSELLVPVALVYIIANVIDMIVIFPVIVAKLVNLHPVLLLAVVAIGQKYYGLVGMLISIPLATALKVIFQEIYSAVYEERTSHPSRISAEFETQLELLPSTQPPRAAGE